MQLCHVPEQTAPATGADPHSTLCLVTVAVGVEEGAEGVHLIQGPFELLVRGCPCIKEPLQGRLMGGGKRIRALTLFGRFAAPRLTWYPSSTRTSLAQATGSPRQVTMICGGSFGPPFATLKKSRTISSAATTSVSLLTAVGVRMEDWAGMRARKGF